MLRRWCMVLALAALTVGTALTATSASAAPAAPTGAGHFSPGGLAHLMGVSAAHTRGLRYEAESTNWSGYAGTTGRYTSVSASWTQPAGVCSRGDQYAAFWVGLDGYSSSTVEQTGSEVDCVGRTAQYYAWYEMYPGPSENYSNTVRAGDHFTATVTYLSGEQFSLFISDTTQGWSHTTDASLGQTPSLSSAEAIVEAPCCTNSGGILPLTDFGTVSLTSTTANGSAIGNAGGLTEIIMIDSAGRDKDSVSSLSGGENFSATWLRSN
jgi:Peptidase A4 family